MNIIYSEKLREVLNSIDNLDLIMENADSYYIVDDSPLNHFQAGFELCNKARDANLNVYASVINCCGIFVLAENEMMAVTKAFGWK